MHQQLDAKLGALPAATRSLVRTEKATMWQFDTDVRYKLVICVDAFFHLLTSRQARAALGRVRTTLSPDGLFVSTAESEWQSRYSNRCELEYLLELCALDVVTVQVTRMLRSGPSVILRPDLLVTKMSNAPYMPYPVQNSTLSAVAVAADLVELYSFSSPVDCTFFRKGICDTYRVRAAETECYLKVYRHGRRTLVDVEEEVRLVRFLAENGISVAEPIRKNDGTFVTTLRAPEGTRYAVLFEAARGVCDDRGDLVKIAALGRLVGRMHRVLDSFPLPYQRQDLDLAHLIDENLDAIGRIMCDRRSDFEIIESIASEIRQLPLFSAMRQPEYGPCHGDLHGGDVAYDRHGNPTLFDFDSSGCGWRAYEIGVFPASVEWMDVSEATASARERRLASFLDSYQESRELTKDELAVVRVSPAIRHIFLMGHVLKHTTITEGSHWADDGFIDWHMTWFRNWVGEVV